MNYCGACGEGAVPLKRCAKCRDAWYCSKTCQREAWTDHHRAECEGYCSEGCRLADLDKISTAPMHYAYGSGPSSGDVDAGALADAIEALPEIKNATRGVPMHWYAAVTLPPDSDSPEYHAQMKRFVLVSKKATIEAVDAIVGLCRKSCVLHAFKTHGGVDKKSRWLINGNKNWTIKPKFKAALQEVIAPFDCCDIVEAEFLVQGIMHKRSKPPCHPLTVTHGHRQFVLIHGTDSGTWFDVTQSNDPTSKDVLTPLPTPVPHRVCRVCGGFGKNVCTRCNRARYCSTDCQATDWRGGHKEMCKASDDDIRRDVLKRAQETMATVRARLVREADDIDDAFVHGMMPRAEVEMHQKEVEDALNAAVVS